LKKFLLVQVRFAQGLVKTFLAPKDGTMLEDFRRAVEAHSSKIKSIRFCSDVDESSVRTLVADGAVLVVARRANA
jgi:hypothetical protein